MTPDEKMAWTTFAAAALQGLAGRDRINPFNHPGMGEIVDVAVQYADSMLSELRKRGAK